MSTPGVESDAVKELWLWLNLRRVLESRSRDRHYRSRHQLSQNR